MENRFMSVAIAEAKKAVEAGEVPIGAAIFKDGELLAKAHNETIRRNNPCAHAEMLAIERAFLKTGDYRLTECDMYVTLEPCPMCAKAIELSRLKRVYFGAYDKEAGAFGGRLDLAAELGFKTEIYGGIAADECADILKKFFRKKG